jgi:hypothetical protein
VCSRRRLPLGRDATYAAFAADFGRRAFSSELEAWRRADGAKLLVNHIAPLNHAIDHLATQVRQTGEHLFAGLTHRR